MKWTSTTPAHCWVEREVCQSAAAYPDTLELTGETDQVFRGFGGCFNELGWIALSKVGQDARTRVLDDLFHPGGALKLSFCRLPIGANDYATGWYSLNETLGDYEMEHFAIGRDRHCLIPYIREALDRNPNLGLFASPWSPPAWMKQPAVYNYGKLIWTRETLDAYALYFARFVQEYGKEGVRIGQIHIQNEPMSSQKFPSCIWTGEEFREFIRDYIGPLFERMGIEAEIWLGTLNGPETDHRSLHTRYDNYANLVLADADARCYIKGVSYQWAGKYAIQRTHDSWPEVELMQSENECGDGSNTWEYSFYVFELLQHYLYNGASYYVCWNMVLEPGGESTWGWRQNALVTADPATGEVVYNPEFHVLKHFSHVIQPGAVRLKTRGHWTGNAICFRNLDGSTAIVVCNAFTESRGFTHVGEQCEFSVMLQPRSINTFVL